MNTSLPTTSAVRKRFPMYSGLLGYFPAALAGVANHSFKGNEKHNPGEELHWARGKSMDHADCIIRHLTDLGDMLAAIERSGGEDPYTPSIEDVLEEADALCWRALALSQELRERMIGAPLAPKAKEEDNAECNSRESEGCANCSEPRRNTCTIEFTGRDAVLTGGGEPCPPCEGIGERADRAEGGAR